MAITGSTMSPLVSVEWLSQHLDDPNLIILDASVAKVVGMAPLEYSHFSCIPNALFLDLADKFHLASSALSNTMPTNKQFSEQASALGIKPESKIVIYDNQGVYSAPRAWWMFKSMGIDNVAVLNGGLPAWLAQGLKTHSQYKTADDIGEVSGNLQENTVLTAQQVLAATDNSEQQIVDARSYSRFCGTAKEPRPGLRSGHIPNSVCVHFATLLNEGRYKSEQALTEIFATAGLDKNKQLIASCGSGMTACIVLLAGYQIGFKQLALYDGSWSEWGADHSLPTSTLS